MKTTDKLAWNSQKLWDLTAFLTVNDHPAVEEVFCLTNSHTANMGTKVHNHKWGPMWEQCKCGPGTLRLRVVHK